MDKRQFLIRFFRAAVPVLGMMAAGLTPGRSGQATAAYPISAFRETRSENILMILFDTVETAEEGGIRIDMPTEIINPDAVPFRVSAPDAEKVAVLAKGNAHPLVLYCESPDYPEGVLMGTFKLERNSEVACYVLRQGLLYWNSIPVRIAGKST